MTDREDRDGQWTYALEVAGRLGVYVTGWGFAGLQQAVDVLRRNMCIITRNTALLSAHLRFEERRQRAY